MLFFSGHQPPPLPVLKLPPRLGYQYALTSPLFVYLQIHKQRHQKGAMSNKNSINSMNNTAGIKTVIDLDQIWGDLNCGIKQVYNRESMPKKR